MVTGMVLPGAASLVDVSRWQFAVTVAFHMTFPALTVGLSVFLTITYATWLRTRDPVYLQTFRFWKRIFALGFALGVVTGTVITFEFGLNWGPFSQATGPILGPIIGMEVVTAFFLEAGFIGIMLYGDGRVSERVMMTATALVAVGTILSTTWIISANSWMQTPAGFEVVNGQFRPTDWSEAIFNPSFVWRYPHMLLAVLISTSLLIAAVGGYYLRRNRHRAFARRALSMAMGVLALLLPVQLYIGDQVALRYVGPDQLPKLASLEGHWDSTGTDYNLIVIPDMEEQRNHLEISVPWLGSAIAKDLSGQTPAPGMDLVPRDQQPNMWATFYGFRVMFYASMVMFFAAFASVVLRLRRRLYVASWFHRFVTWLAPVGVLAVIAGWVLAESGRQPWVVYGQMATEDGVSALAPTSVLVSFVGFLALYLTLLGVWVRYVVIQVRRGPDPADLEPVPGATAARAGGGA